MWDEKRQDRSPINVFWSTNKYRITFNFFIDTLTHPFVWEESDIKKHIVSTYGVPDEMVKPIWIKYKKVIYRKYKEYIETFKDYDDLLREEGLSDERLDESSNGKEKYINYIVEDLVKKTEIDYEQEKITYPSLIYTFPNFNSPLLSFYSSLLPFLPSNTFSKYLKERYGARDEEIQIIWERYKERIQSLIKK